MDMIDHYLAEMDSMDDLRKLPANNDLDKNAVAAFARMVDNEATIEDLQAYRAWISYHRMTGMTEHDLHGAIAVANDTARKLGVA
jgi:hypothetical protein